MLRQIAKILQVRQPCQPQPLKTFYYLLIPSNQPINKERAAGKINNFFLRNSIRHAQNIFGEPVKTLWFNASLNQLWDLQSSQEISITTFQKEGIHFIVNLGFLCSDASPIQEMLVRVKQHKIVWCGLQSSQDIYGCVFSNRKYKPAYSTGLLKNIIHAITLTIKENIKDIWPKIDQEFFLTPNSSCFEHSPTLQEISGLRSKSLANAPKFINTAAQELLSSSQPIPKTDLEAIKQRLDEQRLSSKVPWIFNTLLNEIEYYTGSVDVQSFPPEVHLSTTGFCNIECRFCTYTRSVGRFEFVTAEKVSSLDWLKQIQTLRLHSGLGEPTTNKNLADIIGYVAQNYPHVGINFFTNGLNLNRPGLIDALVGNVRWINVSLNASNRESWKQQCKIDQFHRVCNNLTALLNAKKSKKSLWPVVFGSMVINKDNVTDLPEMPALCHQLGIDRFTVFPFFALGYGGEGKYGAEMTLATCRQTYDELYWPTIEAAQRYQISIEMPPPSDHTKTAFGLEIRQFNDFARIETNEWPMARFLADFIPLESPNRYCHFLWRQVGIGSTHNCGHSEEETHYLYPCIGPLSGLDFSRKTSFRFPNSDGFIDLWNNPIFSQLRQAQHQRDVCEVCDLCQAKDTRDPKEFECLESATKQFSRQYLDR